MMRELRRFGMLFADRRVPAQPVDVHDVAERLVARVAAGPLDGIEEFGGPETLYLGAGARIWSPGTRVVPVRIPGRIGRTMRAGGLTTTATPTGKRTFAEYDARIAGVMGTLKTEPARTRPDLLAPPVAAALDAWPADGRSPVDDVLVAPIDPTLADTAAFCEAYEVGMDVSANCVVVAGKRGGEVRYAACVVLATTRADVNGVVRRLLDARKASFAPMDEAVELTGMEYGGITPIGLPADWPVLVDARVAADAARDHRVRRAAQQDRHCPAPALGALPGAQVIEGLASPVG